MLVRSDKGSQREQILLPCKSSQFGFSQDWLFLLASEERMACLSRPRLNEFEDWINWRLEKHFLDPQTNATVPLPGFKFCRSVQPKRRGPVVGNGNWQLGTGRLTSKHSKQRRPFIVCLHFAEALGPFTVSKSGDMVVQSVLTYTRPLTVLTAPVAQENLTTYSTTPAPMHTSSITWDSTPCPLESLESTGVLGVPQSRGARRCKRSNRHHFSYVNSLSDFVRSKNGSFEGPALQEAGHRFQKINCHWCRHARGHDKYRLGKPLSESLHPYRLFYFIYPYPELPNLDLVYHDVPSLWILAKSGNFHPAQRRLSCSS